MGLDYAYKIYVNRDKLISTLEIVFNKSIGNTYYIDALDGKLYDISIVDKSKKTEITNYGIGSDLYWRPIVKKDNKIIEYFLQELCNFYELNTFINEGYYGENKIDDENVWLNGIEIRINDYGDKIPDMLEISFWAITTNLSILVRESSSINDLFVSICKESDAEYGFLYMESEGNRLIWYEGQICNYTIFNWPGDNFGRFGFIPVIKRIMNGDKF